MVFQTCLLDSGPVSCVVAACLVLLDTSGVFCCKIHCVLFIFATLEHHEEEIAAEGFSGGYIDHQDQGQTIEQGKPSI